jgi:hypothetical protein
MRWAFSGAVCLIVGVVGCSSDDDGSGGSGSGGAGGSATGGSGGSATGGSTNGGSGGLAGGATGGGAGTAGGGGSAGAGGSTCAFSDDFENGSLDPCWATLNGTSASPLIEIEQAGGVLHLRAINGQNGVWYQGATKSLVYKLVTGNFKVTTMAHPRKRTNVNEAPSLALHVGGLMARHPSSNGGNTENYLFTMVGSNEFAEPGVEIKSTTNGASQWSEPTWSNPLAAELRLCRLGASFHAYKRAPGSGGWILADHQGQAMAISRPDLPETLQVGLALNFSGPNNDLDVSFDDITLAATAPVTAADCTSD